MFTTKPSTLESISKLKILKKRATKLPSVRVKCPAVHRGHEAVKKVIQ